LMRTSRALQCCIHGTRRPTNPGKKQKKKTDCQLHMSLSPRCSAYLCASSPATTAEKSQCYGHHVHVAGSTRLLWQRQTRVLGASASLDHLPHI
jgi:hypothetical protein